MSQNKVTAAELEAAIRNVPDFPKPGILFYDVSTLLRDGDAWAVAMGRMAKAVRAYHPDVLAGIESRGFLMAAPLALKLGCGFVMVRKKGKLPHKRVSIAYSLEYGVDEMEMHEDAVAKGEKVVITGFLTFDRTSRAARTGRNPQTGAPVKVAASRKVRRHRARAASRRRAGEARSTIRLRISTSIGRFCAMARRPL